MARFLFDTNILLRTANGADVQNALASAATLRVLSDGHDVYVAPQSIIEFWAVATRPLANNGLDWEVTRVARQAETFLNQFQIAQDTPAIFDAWRRIVSDQQVRGKQVHDARLAAVMERHQITHILTFNVADFVRYRTITPVNLTSLVSTPLDKPD